MNKLKKLWENGVIFNIGKTYITAFFLITLFFSLTSLFFQTTFGQSAFIIVFFISLLLSSLFSFKLNPTPDKQSHEQNKGLSHILPILISFIILNILGAFLFYLIRDISVDGNTYHTTAIISLLEGKSLFATDYTSQRLNFYPKNTEVLFTSFSALRDTIDMGRIFKIFLIFISVINLIYFLYPHLKHSDLSSSQQIKSPKNKYLLALLMIVIIFNPVILYQFFTLYIDDILYLLLLNGLFYLYIGDSKTALFSLSLAIGSKVSYGLFSLLGILAIILIMFFQKNQTPINTLKSRYFSLSSKFRLRLTIIITCIIVGLGQYISNGINLGNPLYGFIGESKKDISTNFQPPEMLNNDPISKFIKVYFSYSRSICNTSTCQHFISPFSKAGIKEFITSYQALSLRDPNINGFGNLYSILLILSSIIFFLRIIQKIRLKTGLLTREKLAITGIITVFIATFSLPFPRARYFPVMFLIPLLFLALLPNKRLIRTVFAVYIANFLLIGAYISKQQLHIANLKHQQIQNFSKLKPTEITFSISDYNTTSSFSRKILDFYNLHHIKTKISENVEQQCKANNGLFIIEGNSIGSSFCIK